MSTPQPDDQRPDQLVLVGPVYLAGIGDTAAIYDSLDDTRGWGKAITDSGLCFTSPRHDVHVAYLPHSRDGGWKITRSHEPLGIPAWTATFSRYTPTEITAAFTDALATCLAAGHAHPWDFGPDQEIALPDDVLAEHGWRTDHTEMDISQYSPDGHAYFSRRDYDVPDHAELAGERRAMWTMYARVDGVNGERWHADFTSCTPLYLLTQTARAFSSTEPVQRIRSSIPQRNLPYVTTTPVPEPDSDRLKSAALARTPHTLPAIPAPATDTALPGPTPPVPFPRR
ncbi:DUF317 domain-containing protein [Actinacidiphila sp. bgisy145]|uniref:DUF317 domain-containing protein n=1 Tax=Actinacidiphila sp. bgisy145 TaxID=3413792 RepID=UPI003EBFD70B